MASTYKAYLGEGLGPLEFITQAKIPHPGRVAGQVGTLSFSFIPGPFAVHASWKACHAFGMLYCTLGRPFASIAAASTAAGKYHLTSTAFAHSQVMMKATMPGVLDWVLGGYLSSLHEARVPACRLEDKPHGFDHAHFDTYMTDDDALVAATNANWMLVCERPGQGADGAAASTSSSLLKGIYIGETPARVGRCGAEGVHLSVAGDATTVAEQHATVYKKGVRAVVRLALPFLAARLCCRLSRERAIFVFASCTYKQQMALYHMYLPRCCRAAACLFGCRRVFTLSVSPPQCAKFGCNRPPAPQTARTAWRTAAAAAARGSTARGSSPTRARRCAPATWSSLARTPRLRSSRSRCST